MKCPFCGKENTRVVDSRVFPDGNSVKRRRICEKCEKRFTTHEKVVDLSLYILKKNGTREAYSRLKVFKGINRAVEKRDVELEKIENLIDKIEQKILREYSGEISSSALGDMIMNSLLDLDEVAYVRFASVYKKFESLDSFVKEIEEIRHERKG